MNDLTLFQSDLGTVRTTVDDNGDTWFVAKDVGDALGIQNIRQVLANLDDDEKGVCKVYTLGGEQEVSVVNEPGLYTLILRSNKPEVKAFKRWITHEVIPAIRKRGFYGRPSIDQLVKISAVIAACPRYKLPIITDILRSAIPEVPKIEGTTHWEAPSIPVRNNFASRLCRAMLCRNLPAEDIAPIIGTTPTELRYWMMGLGSPSEEEQERILNMLEVKTND